jgi:hypothetical protein
MGVPPRRRAAPIWQGPGPAQRSGGPLCPLRAALPCSTLPARLGDCWGWLVAGAAGLRVRPAASPEQSSQRGWAGVGLRGLPGRRPTGRELAWPTSESRNRSERRRQRGRACSPSHPRSSSMERMRGAVQLGSRRGASPWRWTIWPLSARRRCMAGARRCARMATCLGCRPPWARWCRPPLVALCPPGWRSWRSGTVQVVTETRPCGMQVG